MKLTGFFVALVLISGVAHADRDRDRARERAAAGEAKYKAGDLRGAIVDFMAADALVPSPILSFNVALCYDKLGEDAQAARMYRDYLARRPSAPNRAQVEARIDSLQAPVNLPPPVPEPVPPPSTADDLHPPPAQAPDLPPTPRRYDPSFARRVPDLGGHQAPAPASEPSDGAPVPIPAAAEDPIYKKWWFWVAVGVGAVVLIEVASSPGNTRPVTSTGLILFSF